MPCEGKAFGASPPPTNTALWGLFRLFILFTKFLQVFRDIEESLLFDSDQVEQVERLGRGEFGIVYRGILHREVSTTLCGQFL